MRDFNRSSRRSFGGGFDRGSERREMFKAVCDECGRSCEVPFKPSGNKEVFCSSCFEKKGGRDSAFGERSERPERNFNRYDESYGNRPGRGSSNYERNDRRDRGNDREMFSAVCDECGKECQVPFKPTSSKPIYCSSCFDMRGERSGLVKGSENRGGDTSKEIRELKDQLVSVNVKLEKIMKALNIKEEKPKTVKVSKADYTEATKEVVEAPVAEVVAAVAPKAAKKKTVKKTAKKEAE